MTKLVLLPLKEKFGICHFSKNSDIPDWAKGSTSFTSITRTNDELSIICPQEKIPSGVLFEKNWRGFKVKGPLGFVLTGVVSSLSTPLAAAKISILYVDTYETSYLFVEDKNFERAKQILKEIVILKE